ncbi:sigma-54-dependent Fis family transcriptional regulator [Algoriphagus terrigena]|uniref:sigma-54-dependent Fis family transcriptional regulator n=1 Tax=Algoriphagus terrigena TaxID=344884 RepID=UPI0004104A75|nr:sigma 54-interacting transcriptional regulator [Algoriphagus terrigena]
MEKSKSKKTVGLADFHSLKSDGDNGVLLELYRSICRVRSKEDLLESVFPRMKKLFDTQSIFLCLINQESKTLEPIQRVGDDHVLCQSFEELLDQKIVAARGFIECMLESKSALIFDLKTIYEQDNESRPVEILLENGFVSSISKSLRFDDDKFGVISLWSRKYSFHAAHIDLLDQIGDLLSVTVGTLIAQEESKRNKNENDVLLEISNQIASIRSKADISGILSQSLKAQIGYDDAAITVLNSAKSVYEVYCFQVSERRLSHPEFQEAICRAYPVNDADSSFAHVPKVLDVAQMVEAGYEVMDFVFKAGIREIAVVKLIDGESLRGLLVLMSEQKDTFTASSLRLMQRISFQLSIAVSKQCVLEELLWKEKENGILLTIGKELAAIRRKQDLGPLLIQQLKKLGFYSDISIAKIDRENPITFSSFLVNEESPRAANPDYPKMKNRHHTFPDGVFEKALYSPVPIRFDLEELEKKGTIPAYVRFLLDNGTVEMVGAPLRHRNVAIGVLFCFSSQRKAITDFQMGVFQGIGNLLGTAVANIMANTQIEQQLVEINKYKEQLEEEKIYLQQEISNNYAFGEIIGSSAAMQEVYGSLEAVSATDTSVLLLGETGTGKELLARAIHNCSDRKKRLMVKVNCASIPENLIESELFGHEKGAFTGAQERRIGKFELANHGTLFLDEIGELPLHLQPKLLRALQEREIERVGGSGTIQVNVRIIAATNRHLEKAVQEGSFRSDLFYRLNVFPVLVPPLRDRKEDISTLAAHFLHKYAQQTGRNVTSISSSAMKSLMAYSWPGNVRELEHLLERSVLLCKGNVLKDIILPSERNLGADSPTGFAILKTHEENERDYILHVLETCGGKIFGKGGAAETLGLNVSTLNSKIKKLGIKKVNPFDQG